MIRNLQALRFVFIMLVVMSHIIGRSFDFGGECGVSFFFMLSGFILSYAYGEKVRAKTFGHCRFIKKQLSKFYPLHVLLFLIMIVLDARLGRFFSWDKLVANLLLLQSWVPSDDFYFVGNGLSWFLSDLIFFYIVFPMTFVMLMSASLRRLMVGAIVILVLYASLAISIPESLINPLLYAAPWTRLLDFFLGILLFRLYTSEDYSTFCSWLSRQSSVMLTILELVFLFVVVASFFVYEASSLRFLYSSSVSLPTLLRTLSRSAIFPISCICAAFLRFDNSFLRRHHLKQFISCAISTEYCDTRCECWCVRTSLASTAFAIAITVSLAMFNLIC